MLVEVDDVPRKRSGAFGIRRVSGDHPLPEPDRELALGEAAAESEASESARAPSHRHQPTVARPSIAGRTWTAIAISTILLVAIIFFIAQNGERVQVAFVSVHGHLPLGLGLLIAFVAGVAVTVLVGSTRIVRLKLRSRRDRAALARAGRESRP